MIPVRVVLDTNVCLDLFVFRDPACAQLFRKLQSSEIIAFTNEACRSEWLRVLDYEKLQLDPHLKQECVAEFDSVVEFVSVVEASNIPLPPCSDADDQKFMELAMDSGADYLITKDKALLKLNGKTSRAGLFAIVQPFELSRLSGLS